jgi:hypothetical protein
MFVFVIFYSKVFFRLLKTFATIAFANNFDFAFRHATIIFSLIANNSLPFNNHRILVTSLHYRQNRTKKDEMISLVKGLHAHSRTTYMGCFFFEPNYPHTKQVGRHTPRNLRDYWSWSLSIWTIPTDVINRRSLHMGPRLSIEEKEY